MTLQKDEGKEWDSDEVFKMIRIIERLKKRIEILNKICKEDYTEGITHPDKEDEIKELQKILGEKE